MVAGSTRFDNNFTLVRANTTDTGAMSTYPFVAICS